jgi:hypothetical protein
MFKKLITINTQIFKVTNLYDIEMFKFNDKERDIIKTTTTSSVPKESKVLIATLFSRVIENPDILKAISCDINNITLIPMSLIRTVDTNKLVLVKSFDDDNNSCISIQNSSFSSTKLTNTSKSNIVPATEEEIDSFLGVVEIYEMLDNLFDIFGISVIESIEDKDLFKPTVVSTYASSYIYKIQVVKVGGNLFNVIKFLCDDNLNPIKNQHSHMYDSVGGEEAIKIVSKFVKSKNNLCNIISKQERKLNSMMRD